MLKKLYIGYRIRKRRILSRIAQKFANAIIFALQNSKTEEEIVYWHNAGLYLDWYCYCLKLRIK